MKIPIIHYLLFLVSFSQLGYSQTENLFTYQGLLLDEDRNPLSDRTVDFFIIVTSSSGSELYLEEYHSLTTSESGNFSLSIGTGENISGSIGDINWLSSIPLISVSYDLLDGSEIQELGQASFSSVPFALYSEKVICQQGFPGETITGPPGVQGPQGIMAFSGPKGPKGDPGLPISTILNVPPTIDLSTLNPIENGSIYLDDGTNRADGKPGFRYYDKPNINEDGVWVDL